MNRNPHNVIFDRLWHHNPDFTRLLALCPLLIGSDSIPHALVLGAATLLMLVVSTPLLTLLRRHSDDAAHLPALAVLLAALATCLSLWLQASDFTSWQQLSLLLPLVIANGLTLPRNGATLSAAVRDGVLSGLGSALLLLVIGTLRAWLGTTLPLLQLAPGALLLSGLLFAAKNAITRKPTPHAPENVETGSKRARVTGKI